MSALCSGGHNYLKYNEQQTNLAFAIKGGTSCTIQGCSLANIPERTVENKDSLAPVCRCADMQKTYREQPPNANK